VWQFRESTEWAACHPAIARFVEGMPNGALLRVHHLQKEWRIEKYNESMARRTNIRTANKRPLRRVTVTVWRSSGGQSIKNDVDPISFWMGPLNPTQRLTSNQKVPVIVKDRQSYSNWKLLSVDDSDWEMFAAEFGVENDLEQISGCWRWTGSALPIPHRDDLERVNQLYFVPDPEAAARLFEDGGFGSDLTFCGTVGRALELNTFGGRCDGDGNLKVFMCSVFLDEAQQQQLEAEEKCNVAEAERAELVICASVNLELLRRRCLGH